MVANKHSLSAWFLIKSFEKLWCTNWLKQSSREPIENMDKVQDPQCNLKLSEDWSGTRTKKSAAYSRGVDPLFHTRKTVKSIAGKEMSLEPPPFQEASRCDVCKCSFNTFRRRVLFQFSNPQLAITPTTMKNSILLITLVYSYNLFILVVCVRI